MICWGKEVLSGCTEATCVPEEDGPELDYLPTAGPGSAPYIGWSSPGFVVSLAAKGSPVRQRRTAWCWSTYPLLGQTLNSMLGCLLGSRSPLWLPHLSREAGDVVTLHEDDEEACSEENS